MWWSSSSANVKKSLLETLHDIGIPITEILEGTKIENVVFRLSEVILDSTLTFVLENSSILFNSFYSSVYIRLWIGSRFLYLVDSNCLTLYSIRDRWTLQQQNLDQCIPLHRFENQKMDNDTMNLKLMFQKSTKKFLFAQAKDHFVDFLFSIYPQYSVAKNCETLKMKTSLMNINNFYEGVSNLSTDKIYRTGSSIPKL